MFDYMPGPILVSTLTDSEREVVTLDENPLLVNVTCFASSQIARAEHMLIRSTAQACLQSRALNLEVLLLAVFNKVSSVTADLNL